MDHPVHVTMSEHITVDFYYKCIIIILLPI